MYELKDLLYEQMFQAYNIGRKKNLNVTRIGSFNIGNDQNSHPVRQISNYVIIY
jgi:hypothetical protein